MNNKSIIYARVSTNEQEETGYSLSSQEKMLNEYAIKKGFDVIKTFSIAESASGAKQRQIFDEMIELSIKEGVTDLLVEKVDRFTRNLKDAVSANDWMDADEKRKIHFVKQSLIVHKNAKSDEKFRWDIEVVLAKKYIANLSEEVKKGQKEKLAQGWLPTKPPIGYKTIGDHGKKIHVIDPGPAAFVKKAYEYYASGNYSMRALIDKLYDEGLRTRAGGKFAKSRMEDLLSEPFYYGAMVWKDVLYNTGKHEPIISKELFDQVHDIRTNRKAPHKYKHSFIFSKMIKCGECEGTITAEIQKGITYYHCNHYRDCKQKIYAPENLIESQVIEFFEVFQHITQEEADEVARRIREDHASEINYKENQIITLQNRDKNLRNRLDVLYDDKLDGKISYEFWQSKQNVINKERSDIERDLARIRSDETKYFEIGINVLDLARRASEIYKKRTPEEKRMLLRSAFTSMTLLGKKLTYEPSEGFKVISKRVKEKISAEKVFEPKTPLQNKGVNGKAFNSELVLPR